MKKTLTLLCAAAMVAACTKRTVVQDDLQPPVTKATVIDLNDFSYNGVLSLLNETKSLSNITFVDGDISKSVAELSVVNNVDALENQLLMLESAKDSVSVLITPDLITINTYQNGQEIAYVSYGNPQAQTAVADYYSQVVGQTKANGESLLTKSVSNQSLKMNLTRSQELLRNVENLPEPSYAFDDLQTKGWWSNLWNNIVEVFKPKPAPVPTADAPVLNIYMLKEKGSNNLPHEIKWQQEDAVKVIRGVQPNLKFNFIVESCSFKSPKTTDGWDACVKFEEWICKTKPYSARMGYDIFFLIRWGGWGILPGVSFTDVYDVNTPGKNIYTAGISSTNAWNEGTFAHELSHILGAQDIYNTSEKWKYTGDVMGMFSCNWFFNIGTKHTHPENIKIMQANLTKKGKK